MYRPLSQLLIAFGVIVATLPISTIRADIVAVPETELTMNSELRKDIQRTVAFLQNDHYLPRNLDDRLSANILETYLERLDPIKLHFTQQDVDRLKINESKIDDYMKLADAEFAFEIYKLYRQRIKQRTELVLELLKEEFDFSVDENMNVDRDNHQWAKNEDEIAEKWRKRIKNDVLQQLLAETAEDEIRDNLARRYARQRDVVYQLKPDEVFEIFMNAYTKELGPHTQYMSHITAENFRINMSLSLEGIGAALQTDED
ncbi:MAG: carboxy terminal-processing peptidase, partial [bacterium]